MEQTGLYFSFSARHKCGTQLEWMKEIDGGTQEVVKHDKHEVFRFYCFSGFSRFPIDFPIGWWYDQSPVQSTCRSINFFNLLHTGKSAFPTHWWMIDTTHFHILAFSFSPFEQIWTTIWMFSDITCTSINEMDICVRSGWSIVLLLVNGCIIGIFI